MRLVCLALVALSLAACDEAEPIPLQADVAVAGVPVSSHQGLELRARLESPARLPAGQRVEVATELVNTSQVEHHYVEPGDGSWSGWREPEMRYSVTRDGVPLTTEPLSRCGNYDEAWPDDVKALAPGARAELPVRIDPSHFFDFSQPGSYLLRAHYRYQAGRDRASKGKAPPSMADVRPFELVSDPVAFEVVPSFAVQVSVVGELERGVHSRLSDVVHVELHNVSGASLPLGDDWHQRLHLEVRKGSSPRIESPEPTLPGDPRELAADAREQLIGPGGAHDGSWLSEERGTIELRAQAQGVYSDWVTVTVR